MPPNNSPADSRRISRSIYGLHRLSAHPVAPVLVIGTSIGMLLLALVSRRPDQILSWFAGIASFVTLLMVFVLQHTQTRHQTAIQHKLDEVLHALPGADDRLIQLEAASANDLTTIAEKHTALLDQAIEVHEGGAAPTKPRR